MFAFQPFHSEQLFFKLSDTATLTRELQVIICFLDFTPRPSTTVPFTCISLNESLVTFWITVFHLALSRGHTELHSSSVPVPFTCHFEKAICLTWPTGKDLPSILPVFFDDFFPLLRFLATALSKFASLSSLSFHVFQDGLPMALLRLPMLGAPEHKKIRSVIFLELRAFNFRYHACTQTTGRLPRDGSNFCLSRASLSLHSFSPPVFVESVSY